MHIWLFKFRRHYSRSGQIQHFLEIFSFFGKGPSSIFELKASKQYMKKKKKIDKFYFIIF